MDNLIEAQIFQSVLMEYKGVPVILTTIMGVDRKTPRPTDQEIINNINFEELEKDL